MKQKIIKTFSRQLIAILLFLIPGAVDVYSENTTQRLSLQKFIDLATKQDTEFEQILIDELALKYQKNLKLPAKDIVLSVKEQHEFYFSQDRDSPDTTIGLNKLFPYIGTEVNLDYQIGSSISSVKDTSEASFTIAQPIAENAFGRSTRLLDKIVGLEVDVASHQIAEAYEDYLASIIISFYTWYEDHENLSIGRSSYKENTKLLENMKEREKQKIALPIDVNKVRLQVLSKEEKLVELEEKYKSSLNIIERIIRDNGGAEFIPQEPEPMADAGEDFEGMFSRFTRDSRTFEALRMLEEKSSLEVARDADDLLPSIDFIAGYEVSGEDYDIVNEDNFLYAGISIEWPLSDQVERAGYEISKIRKDKQKILTVNTYYRLYTRLVNLYLQMEREKKLAEIAGERIGFAQSILRDETENYSFGKVTLNDYIQAFNDLDNNRFNKISHDSQYKKAIVEWLRLSDRLVNKADLVPKIENLKTQTAGKGKL